jgi:hypothetical protein
MISYDNKRLWCLYLRNSEVISMPLKSTPIVVWKYTIFLMFFFLLCEHSSIFLKKQWLETERESKIEREKGKRKRSKREREILYRCRRPHVRCLCVTSWIKIWRSFDHCFIQIQWTWRRFSILEFSLFCEQEIIVLILALDSSCLVERSNES